MFALGLLTCIVLRAFSTQAKVVTSFGECKDFFYKNTEPGGMDQNAKKICQKYGEGGRYYYATLYSVSHRIPLYSAYTLDSACSSTPGVSCGKKWYVEPQVTINFDKNIIKKNQAIYSDYTNSGYDRSHLNPNSFQCGTGRTSTCTLTNAAPMKAYFNRIHWNRWESTLRRLLKDNHVRDGASATAYIVTGTVPSSNERIPKRGTSGDSERVTVPSHIWTAVCYKHLTDDTKSFSFGFMGRNQPAEPGINLINVSNLNDQLRLCKVDCTWNIY
uniref:Si:ch211-165i18.2 n=1 Tax=Cyprinus carpio TaxID=7962 RepID=A0A8C2KN39_CYPCA